ncbi:hypothetical protein AX774_g3770, partial [Zancudomyces culisetae]
MASKLSDTYCSEVKQIADLVFQTESINELLPNYHTVVKDLVKELHERITRILNLNINENKIKINFVSNDNKCRSILSSRKYKDAPVYCKNRARYKTIGNKPCCGIHKHDDVHQTESSCKFTIRYGTRSG